MGQVSVVDFPGGILHLQLVDDKSGELLLDLPLPLDVSCPELSSEKQIAWGGDDCQTIWNLSFVSKSDALKIWRVAVAT